MQGDTSSSTAPPADASASVESPTAHASVLEKFLAKRELLRRATGKMEASSPSKLPWHAYSQRRYGERVARLRAAMRVPEPDYAESLDAYVRRKKQQRLLDLHADAADVSAEYDAATRAMFFEREVVDQPVCDREENRRQFDEEMAMLASTYSGSPF